LDAGAAPRPSNGIRRGTAPGTSCPDGFEIRRRANDGSESVGGGAGSFGSLEALLSSADDPPSTYERTRHRRHERRMAKAQAPGGGLALPVLRELAQTLLGRVP
jgi:hypothetical protein